MPVPEQNQHLILWDIDGTLVNSRASRSDKHAVAVEMYLSRDVPNHQRAGGKTDRQILCELLEVQEVVPSSEVLIEVLRILDDLSVAEINQCPVMCNPGVANALKMTNSNGWVNGLLTGNTPVRGKAKLESAKIWDAFDRDFAFFGDGALSRENLVSSSLNSIRSAGFTVTVAIGDTPLDIRSAKENNLQAVAVTTGLHCAEKLRGFDPDLLIQDCVSGLAQLLGFLDSLHGRSFKNV